MTSRDEGRIARFNASRVLARSCESLLGICHGLIADDALNQKELDFLRLWLRDNAEIASVWPGSAISDRIETVTADGIVTKEELENLNEVLAALVGGTLEQTGAAGGIATSLPINPAAQIEFAGRSFCFTGKFLFGTRKACAAAVADRGGEHCESITTTLSFLVIGTLVSPDWMYSSHGRKVERAVELRELGRALEIVGEEQWVRALNLRSVTVAFQSRAP